MKPTDTDISSDADGNAAESAEAALELPTETAAISEHRLYLDGVRGAAALVVIIHHLWLQAKLPFTLYGHFAVGLFIVLSGFCLALPVAANEGTIPGGVFRYYARRALRILPPYYLCLALSVLLVNIWHLETISSQALTTHLFLIHDAYLRDDLAINSPLWTIAVEWRIYLVFPLLVLASRFWGAVPTAIICGLTSEMVYRCLQDTSINVGLHGVSPHYLTLFAMGMLGAGIVQGREQILARGWAGWLWWPIVGVLSYLVYSAGTAPQSAARPWDYVVGLWATALLVLISIPAGKWARLLFSFRPLVWCGMIGYSLYLLHMPLIRILEKYLQGSNILTSHTDAMTRFWYMTGIGLPAILLASCIFFFLCELPFRRWSRQIGRQNRPTEEPTTPRLAAPESAI